MYYRFVSRDYRATPTNIPRKFGLCSVVKHYFPLVRNAWGTVKTKNSRQTCYERKEGFVTAHWSVIQLRDTTCSFQVCNRAVPGYKQWFWCKVIYTRTFKHCAVSVLFNISLLWQRKTLIVASFNTTTMPDRTAFILLFLLGVASMPLQVGGFPAPFYRVLSWQDPPLEGKLTAVS